MRIAETDILILGSGVAGLNCALKCADFARVTVVSKGKLEEGSTRLAQGGIACVLSDQDSFEKHITDTYLVGGKKGNRKAIEIMVKEAPARMLELSHLGMEFDTDHEGNPDLALEGGHSAPRVMHVKDSTGKALEHVLLQSAKKNSAISFLENAMARDLFLEDGTCSGAWVWDETTAEYIIYKAKFTVIATGGAGQVYSRTTNPDVATGDGFAMAHRAGAKLENMQYVQFHPTALFHPDAKGFLISEALRGAGAELVLADGQKFMHRYHPAGSLAPRNVVSYAIATEMRQHHIPCVYLNTRAISMEMMKRKFPLIFSKCEKLNIHVPFDFIPVAPSAHYMCGGIKTDIDGRSNIPNLFAIGEVSCTGVHGNNRLASNSLLEGLVFSHRAAQAIRKAIPQFSRTIGCAIPFFIFNKKITHSELRSARKKVQKIMWEHAGIMRTEADLEKGISELYKIMAMAEDWRTNCFPNRDILDLYNLAETAILISIAALKELQHESSEPVPAEMH